MKIKKRYKSRVIMLLLVLFTIQLLMGCGKSVLEDGTYTANVTLEGGSGRVSVESPAQITVDNGQVYATIVWSSEYYDYMIVDGEKYLDESTEGNSTFTIPVLDLNKEMSVIGDTTAMSTPHEIEYTLYFEMEE